MHTSCMHSCMRSGMQVRPVGRVVSVGLLVVSRVVERRFAAGEPPRGGDPGVARGPRGRSKRRETTSDDSRRRRFARPGDHGHDAFGDEEVEVRRIRRRRVCCTSGRAQMPVNLYGFGQEGWVRPGGRV